MRAYAKKLFLHGSTMEVFNMAFSKILDFSADMTGKVKTVIKLYFVLPDFKSCGHPNRKFWRKLILVDLVNTLPRPKSNPDDYFFKNLFCRRTSTFHFLRLPLNDQDIV